MRRRYPSPCGGTCQMVPTRIGVSRSSSSPADEPVRSLSDVIVLTPLRCTCQGKQFGQQRRPPDVVMLSINIGITSLRLALETDTRLAIGR